MNAVEIEEAISQLAEQPFDAATFPFAFLEAFGNKATTIKRLRNTGKGSSNASDLDGGVLQRNNIHIAVCAENAVTATLTQLKNSPATSKAKAKFILATDGVSLEAEDMNTGDTVACDYADFPNHFGFFLPLAGISTVRQIRNNPIDIQATGRLNRLYVELLKDNADWATEDGRHAMNQFMTRLIFCFFAEDTDIFLGDNLFTSTLEQMSDARSGNTDFVIGELFRAMDIALDDRAAADLPRWADAFPYVNGGLFAGGKAIPAFSRIARSYLLHVGKLDWKSINPDIFGSMIQAVADDDERGELGMHYTSVPNILKVLNPLFLDDLREQLEQAGDNARKLLNLRRRLANIRVFDPACGSGNFLVIAYIQLREIEVEILRRRGEANESGFVNQKSWILLKNFYGIEIKDFAVEVARLSLLIAEFQCDVRFLGQKEAMALVLPLKKTGQIRCGNALRVDWLDVCPAAEDAEVETYICGNPPYKGTKYQTKEQKHDLELVFNNVPSWKVLDYVAGWFFKGVEYCKSVKATIAFVSTNSICQGQQVPVLWPLVFEKDLFIQFAYTSFKWKNLATKNAGVTVVIAGFGNAKKSKKNLFDLDENNEFIKRQVENINAYLIPGDNTIIFPQNHPISNLPKMYRGNSPTDGGNLLLSAEELDVLELDPSIEEQFIKPFIGSAELINGKIRYCIWIEENTIDVAKQVSQIKARVDSVRDFRLLSKKKATRKAAAWPHRFDEIKSISSSPTICIPVISSENRDYLPVGLLPPGSIISNKVFGLSSSQLWPLAIICSNMNKIWVSTICARMRTDFSYTNTLGWNTFPIPKLTEKNKTDLTRCAENILLAREAHFPKTIADLYKPEDMPDNLRHAHEQNDEVLERIYIGRRFKNDTERLEKLFELYTKMTSKKAAAT